MLGQVESQILIADIVAVFVACMAVIAGITLVDMLVAKADKAVKVTAYIVFIVAVVVFIRPLSEYFLAMDEFLRAKIGNYDVSDLTEPTRRLIKMVKDHVGA